MTHTDTDFNIHHLHYQDKEITLVGTAHVSRESADLVREVIAQEKPETVCVELCQSRYQSLTQKKLWQDTNLIKVIREKKAFLLLANLMLASFQKRIGKKLGIQPGQEIIQAIDSAKEAGAEIHLADRDIRITLGRTWRLMGFWKKIKLLSQFIISLGQVDDITQEEIEKLKERDVLETLLSEIGQSMPEIRNILIDERDQYLTEKIRTAPGKRIVAIVGAGHVPGIQNTWDSSVDLAGLEQMPPKGRLLGFLKWAIPAAIIGMIVAGFFTAGTAGGAHMLKWWILANSVLSGLGAALAFAHPITIFSAVVAAPLTSLNPLIAAGWVSGLVEAVLSKPKVKDFEMLPEDIVSLKGFWRNKITRILMVVVLTNLGSSLGTFVAIPLMAKVFS
jgi:pheromone shutdown-related protein TraB